ncbi:prolipoprotein diacylglyceryl transferase family protein [Intestinimonas massiliensis (ex Afouda et al. 2020)]|uniref:prolipoprotein diacylglyceryl transferase family protein n=1 Tax=Intestinimonas massiliensis (ex Afouda et al. 2020) TaxID=1673721 RepID=UPI00103085FA|nr:prolipoprotein diacylglyceryl transferase family protein [Intestinimonas massiliensis (ex Afouda et al. 2020)]
METLLMIFKTYTVPILAVSCIPLVGVLLWLLRDRLQLTLRRVAVLSVAFVATGFISIIVFGVIHDIAYFPRWTFQHQGLIFFMPLWFLVAAKWLKKDWRDVFDVFAVVMPFVVAGVRLYCIAKGCCYGLPLFHSEVLRWPVREITCILNVAIGIIFYLWIRKVRIRGTMLPTYFMLYSVIRFTEVMMWGNRYRDYLFEDRGLALFSFVLGLGLYWELKDRAKKATGRL